MAEMFEVRVSAPGKVILHGEHAVVFGKTAIAGSLGLRSFVHVKEGASDAPSLNIKLPAIKFEATIKSKAISDKLLKRTNSSWKNPQGIQHDVHLENVERFLEGMIPHFDNLDNYQKNALRGFFYLLSGIYGSGIELDKSLNIEVGSELTIGAGTGSSASYAVCLAGALVQLVKLKSGLATKDFSTDDKKLISNWAFNSERIMHGAPSGIDNSIATFGSMVSFKKGEELKIVEFNVRVLLVNTQVSRETRAVTARVAQMRSWNGGAVDSVMDAIGHVTENAELIFNTLSRTNTETEVEKQYQRLSALWDMNHCLLASLDVSHPTLEVIRETAREHGLSSKLTGAGAGGYAIVLVPPSTSEATVEALKRDLLEKGFLVTDTRLGGPGVTLDQAG